MEHTASALGLLRKHDFEWARHPLSYLVEAADDTCYTILDLEDAHEMHLLQYEEIKDILEPLCREDPQFDSIISGSSSSRRKVSFLRGKSIGVLATRLVDTFISNIDKIMTGNLEGSLIQNAEQDIKDTIKKAQDITKEKIFTHPRKIELEIGSYSILGELLESLCTACHAKVTGTNKTFKNSRIIDLLGHNAPEKGSSLYEAYLTVTDYVSGMTDSYATHIASQLKGQVNSSGSHSRFG